MRLIHQIIYFFVIPFFVSPYANAQQAWGIANSNYAGVSNIDLNPSNMVMSKLGWDLNLINFDANFYNNSFYADPTFAFPMLFKQDLKFTTSNTENKNRVQSADLVIHDNIQKNTFVNINATIKGPSFMYSNGVSAFAITSAFRSGVSTFGLPESTVKMGFENLNYPPLYNQILQVDKGTAAAAMAWLEIGGSYARKLKENHKFLITGGVSLKFLVGYVGGYGVSQGIDFMIPHRGNFTAVDLNLDYGHAVNQSNPISLFNPMGTGASIDIGFTIMEKKKGRYSYIGCPMLTRKTILVNRNYKWKLGLSLIDLGGINFNTNAAAYSYKNVSYSWDAITHVKAKKIGQADQLIYDNFSPYGNVSTKNSFFIWTPTAISAQFDYNCNDKIFINGSIVQRIVINSEARLARMNSLAVTPRYETAGFEFAFPVIINEYMYPNMGLMIRYQSFFIGTDQLGSTLGITALYGLDVYLGIKINGIAKNKDSKVRF